MSDNSILDDLGRESKPAAEPKPVPEGWRLIPDVDLVAYYADDLGQDQPSFSNSLARPLLDETPLDAAYSHPRLNPDYGLEKAKATAAQRRGDVVHQLALGRGRGFAIGDFKTWGSNDAKAFKERAEEEGLTPVKRADFEEAEIIAAVVKDKIRRVLDGADYITEVAVLYQEETPHGPIWVRSLMDVWCEERAMILDPKVTAQLYDKMVGKHMANMGWDRQLALYERGVGRVLPHLAGRIQGFDLMVKPEAPFTHRIVAPERASKHGAIKEAVRAMETFASCLYSGRWPGFGDEAHYIPAPPWVAKERETAELRDIAG